MLFRNEQENSREQTKPSHLDILKKGVNAWNQWREEHLDLLPDLSNANLGGITMAGANFKGTNFEKSSLKGNDLKNADLSNSHLEGADLSYTQLVGANLQRAFFDNATRLDNAKVGDEKGSSVLLADVYWGSVNLAVVDWTSVKMLGDEYVARQKKHDGKVKDRKTRLEEYGVAIRANRQLVVALTEQGLTDTAAYFNYRMHLLQLNVLMQQRQIEKFALSFFLYLLTGYGYRPFRLVFAYLYMVLVFALAYFFLASFYVPHLSLIDALILSATVFTQHSSPVSQLFSPTDPLYILGNIEVIVSLVISFILANTFAKRFFD
jgi:hypothetical protein